MTFLSIWLLCGTIMPLIILFSTRKKKSPHGLRVVILGLILGPIPLVILAGVSFSAFFVKDEEIDVAKQFLEGINQKLSEKKE